MAVPIPLQTSISPPLGDRPRASVEEIKTSALQDAIFKSAYFSSIATDERGVIQIFNVGAERMLGYAAADVVNRITPADISDPQELVARAGELSDELDTPITPGFDALVFKASRGIEDIYELTYVRKDGSRFPAIVSVTSLRDADDTIIGYLLIGTDNTARQQVEEAQALLDQQLRDQQYYTRSIIESNIDALMMTDPQGRISDVNQQMIRLTGRSREELIGQPSKTFFTDPARAEEAISRVLAEDTVTDYELTVRAKNGVETVVSYNAATFSDEDHRLRGVFMAARDVTERKHFERTLLEKNIELQHASRMKSEFLATMSHELRTPLNAIIGFSEALGDGLIGPMSPNQQEYVGDIFTSGQHLLSLINDILDLSKVEAGMMALELEPVDVRDLLRGSLTIVREKAATHRVELDLEADEELGLLQLDLRKTKQIVYNLLANAVKFSAGNGRVLLSARRVPREAVGHLPGDWPVHGFPMKQSAHEQFLQLCVTDSGIGISEADMATLFQAFKQIDSSLARQFDGTGLGLAMVRQLVELHGGTVAVSSAAGEGACFAAWLPLLPADVPEAGEDEIRHAEHDDQARTVLVVEDDDRAAELMRVLLESEGFAVVRAASGEEALTVAPGQPLSLITLDVQLPGMDGWEVLSRLREQPLLATIPVLVVSGHIDDPTMAVAGGAAAILQKPVSRGELNGSLLALGLGHDVGRSRTVLVVDDDPLAVELIAAFLPAPAYVVVRAYGGAEAISLAKRLRPELVLLDLMMPEVTGFDVVEALRGDPITARIPILVVTAKQIGPEDREVLGHDPDRVIGIVDKAGFNRAGFLAEVRRALPADTRIGT